MGELFVQAYVQGAMPYDSDGRISAKINAFLPIVLRPDPPGTKLAAAIWADVVQDQHTAGRSARDRIAFGASWL